MLIDGAQFVLFWKKMIAYCVFKWNLKERQEKKKGNEKRERKGKRERKKQKAHLLETSNQHRLSSLFCFLVAFYSFHFLSLCFRLPYFVLFVFPISFRFIFDCFEFYLKILLFFIGVCFNFCFSMIQRL